MAGARKIGRKDVHVHFVVDEPLRKRLATIAQVTDSTPSRVLRMALRSFLDAAEKQSKRAARGSL